MNVTGRWICGSFHVTLVGILLGRHADRWTYYNPPTRSYIQLYTIEKQEHLLLPATIYHTQASPPSVFIHIIAPLILALAGYIETIDDIIKLMPSRERPVIEHSLQHVQSPLSYTDIITSHFHTFSFYTYYCYYSKKIPKNLCDCENLNAQDSRQNRNRSRNKSFITSFLIVAFSFGLDYSVVLLLVIIYSGFPANSSIRQRTLGTI